MRRTGFTLIELLIVIAVVSIIAAILFPVFTRVRERGRSTVCVANLRQIGIATTQYCEDWDGRFPYGGDPCDLNTTEWIGTPYVDQVIDMEPIQDVLGSYTHNHLIWHCPSDTGYEYCKAFESSPVGLIASPTAYKAFGDSYAYNTILTFLPVTLGTVEGTDNEGIIHGPSDIQLFQIGRAHV